jgi:hypothetical protein
MKPPPYEYGTTIRSAPVLGVMSARPADVRPYRIADRESEPMAVGAFGDGAGLTDTMPVPTLTLSNPSFRRIKACAGVLVRALLFLIENSSPLKRLPTAMGAPVKAPVNWLIKPNTNVVSVGFLATAYNFDALKSYPKARGSTDGESETVIV